MFINYANLLNYTVDICILIISLLFPRVNILGKRSIFSPFLNQIMLISSLFFHASTDENLNGVFQMARSAGNVSILAHKIGQNRVLDALNCVENVKFDK